MKILALDISSSSTGFSIVRDGKLIKKWTGTIKPNKKDPQGKRFQFFEQEIKRLIQLYKPDQVIIEDIFKGPNILTFKTLAMYRSVAIKAIYDEINQDPISIMPSSARSLVGVRNDKEAAFYFVTEKYSLTNYKFGTHNDITDAIILGLAAWEMRERGLTEKDLRPKKKRKRKRKRRK